MTVSPGWYADPADRSTQRYWNGEDWQGAAVPVGTHPQGAPPPPPLPEPAAPAPVSAEPAPAPAADRRTARFKPERLTEPVRPHGMMLATPGARLTARLIDIAAVAGLNVIVNGWFIYLWFAEMIPYSQAINRALVSGESLWDITPPARLDELTLAIVITAAALWFAYEVPAYAHSGQTPGKRAMRIKVVRVESEEPLGFLRSWRRWNPLGLPILFCGWCGPATFIFQAIDLMFIPMDPNQRMALHDRSAGTYVVQLPHDKAARSRTEGSSNEQPH